ncbi:MAG: peptidase M28, partial [Bacteroidota bacterium]
TQMRLPSQRGLCEVTFKSLTYNGMSVKKDSTGNVLSGRESNFLMHYYVSASDSLEVKYELNDGLDPRFSLLEYSLDLMENEAFTVNQRPKHTMPRPFVTTDAVIVRRSLDINALRAVNDTIMPPVNE